MDILTREQRSQRMRLVRQRDTSPERVVRSFLHKEGYRFSLQRRDLPGKPDIVLPKHATVIFVNGCFWHRHKNCKRATTPETNKTFWLAKFKANVERDHAVTAALKEAGWCVLVVWECETVPELSSSAKRRLRAIRHDPSKRHKRQKVNLSQNLNGTEAI